MTNYSSNSSKERRALVTLQSNFSPFGNKLIQAGYVDRHQMQKAQSESRQSGKPLLSILEEITGKPVSPELQRQYKKQQLFELKVLHGIEVVDPELEQISAEQVAYLMDTLISVDMCRRHDLLPLAQLETTPPSLLVAMVDPDNLTALDDLNQILRPQKLALQKRVIAEEDCQQLLDQYLEAKAQKQKDVEEAEAQKLKEAAAREAELSLILDPNALDDVEIGEAAGGDDDGMDLDVQLKKEADSAPIVRTVNQILARALTEAVSDIHIEPQEEFLRIRMRKDGVLQEYLRLPKKIVNPLVSRFKIMADLDIAERRKAQDGRIRRIFQGRTVDFRVNCLPSRYGEKICIKVLDPLTVYPEADCHLQVVRITGLDEAIAALLTQYLQNVKLPADFSGEMVLELWVGNGRMRRIVLDDEASTLDAPELLDPIKRALFSWKVPSGVAGTVRITLRINS
jgi:type IV pilus assembly protein PilB